MQDELIIQPYRPDHPTRRDRVEARNHVMVVRYYYWTEIRRRRFDDVICILSNDEFFVEERTISNTIVDFSDYLNELYVRRPGVRDLEREYPSWCWRVLN